ncbi:MAG: hypothetical protein V2A76_09880 [Planctomycetota bacterium]
MVLPRGDRWRPNATWLEESVSLLEGVPLGSVSLRREGRPGMNRPGMKPG